MAAIYATVDEFFDFIGEAKPGADELTPADELKLQRQLARASTTVRAAARLGRYRLGGDGRPAATPVLHAFRDATCSQVEAMLGSTGDSTGAGADWDSVKMLDVAFSRSKGTVAERDALDGNRLTPEAREHLVASGIFGPRVGRL